MTMDGIETITGPEDFRVRQLQAIRKGLDG